MSQPDPPLAVVVKGWPRLSETFIAQELVALEEAGHSFDLWSLRFPTDKKRHALHDRLKARVRYLPEYLHQEPARVLRGWRAARQMPGYADAYRIWRADLARERTRNRVRRFGQACVMAAEMAPGTRGLYAHFLHTPSSVARYAAVMRGLPWSFSAHAKDIWTSPDWELREKLAAGASGARFGATCTGIGADYLRDRSQDPDRIDLVYHGLDLARFPDPPAPRNRREGDPLALLSVGRLVEKKGFDRLIDALALLADAIDWHWTHIGGGEMSDALRARAEAAGLGARITWRGACDQAEVIEAMRAADLFVLPSRVARSGDRDGLPNVLMEAASQRLPLLSTPVSAIPEFITDGVHGVLTDDTPEALASAIEQIAATPGDASARAEAALDRLRAEFGMAPGIAALSARLNALTGAG